LIKNIKRQKLSPWVTLIEKTVRIRGLVEDQIYHSFAQLDYVSILAITSEGRILTVRQYRPALDKFTLELPGGLIDEGENPEIAATRELFEETGYVIAGDLEFLGCLSPDTGRLENKLWCYLAKGVVKSEELKFVKEQGLDIYAFSLSE